MRKVKNLLVMFVLCLFTTIAFAQKDKSFKTIVVPTSKDNAFDKVIDYLQAKDIFIESLDKGAGFVQGKLFVKHRKMLSAKAGERMTMNFILRPVGNETKIMLNIYLEHYNFLNTYYFEDKGIVDDAAIYRDILSGIQKAIDM